MNVNGKYESYALTFDEVEKILLYFATSIFGQNTVDEILWDLAKNCISQLKFVDCVVYLVNKEKNILTQKAAYGPKNPVNFELYRPIDIPFGQGITGTVAVTGKPEIVNDTGKDPRYIVDDQVRASEIAVPIVYNNEVIGIIDSEHPAKDFFTQQHLRILIAIASLCANKILKARADEENRLNQEKLIETSRLLAELRLQVLRSHMNPHFVFNSLNAMQHFITRDDQKSALKYLSKFGKLIRAILDNISVDYILLAEELQILSLYLELESMRFEEHFKYQITIDKHVNQHTCKVPFLLIQPFIEKAINYGLVNKHRHGLVSVHISKKNGLLKYVISDNGIGRIKGSQKANEKGLNFFKHKNFSTKERVKLMSKSLNNTIKLKTEDLYSQDSQPLGTRVEISFSA
ncbi:histidine kinase [Fulvivirgaceae bacterium BMA12]|uniref:Histidine kinase n=1 Tax=Agaribacillus aureus TaxID=3051825 RepID=A0ABT8L396_9BACT|nr:histidine kinase [Fulvivirgaceae bacterium BMA12]